MKLITSVLFSMLIYFADAQTIILQENFTTYDGTAATTPAGWTISNHGNYTTTASSGVSGPNSYGFKVDSATVTTPAFSSADSVTFWIKGLGTDTISVLYIWETYDGSTWNIIDSIKPLPTGGTAKAFPIAPIAIQLKFTYTKSVGNLAFDDFKVWYTPPITANFIASDVCFGDSVLFTDLSSTKDGSSPAGWWWDFGDGNTSNEQNPSHFYTVADTFNVKLTVSNLIFDTDDTIIQIIVYPKPMAGFSPTDEKGCAFKVVTFIDSSTVASGAINSFLWNFGNGDTLTTDTSTLVIAQYPNGGNYTVTLIVTSDKGCQDTATGQVTVYEAIPDFGFSISSSTVMFLDSSYTINDTIISRYWDFDDGDTSDAQNPVHTYADTGSYTVCLSILTSNFCYYSVCKTISISASIPLVASFSLSGASFCPEDTLSFFNGSAAGAGGSIISYEWDFGDGTAITTTQNSSHAYSIAGTYDITLTITDSLGNMDDTTIAVTIGSIPAADFIVENIGCSPVTKIFHDSSSAAIGSIIGYSWDFGNGNSSTQPYWNQQSYPLAGNYMVSLTVETDKGCKDTTVLTMWIDTSLIAAFTYAAGSAPGEIIFENKSTRIVNFWWMFGEGNSSSSQNPVHTYSSNGEYEACLYAWDPDWANPWCADTLCKTITVTNISDTTGIKEIIVGFVKVYPNPSNGIIFIENITSEVEKIAVTDIVGRMIAEKSKITSVKEIFDLSAAPAGIYFISIKTKEGTITKKISISR